MLYNVKVIVFDVIWPFLWWRKSASPGLFVYIQIAHVQLKKASLQNFTQCSSNSTTAKSTVLKGSETEPMNQEWET